ncbi:MAG: DUF6737 family protein [Cyanobium sp.]
MADPGDLWSHKPWWCQPWSILLTGVALISGSWVVLRLWWITAPLTAAVLLWWWLFLVLVPAGYRAAQQQGGPLPDGDPLGQERQP